MSKEWVSSVEPTDPGWPKTTGAPALPGEGTKVCTEYDRVQAKRDQRQASARERRQLTLWVGLACLVLLPIVGGLAGLNPSYFIIAVLIGVPAYALGQMIYDMVLAGQAKRLGIRRLQLLAQGVELPYEKLTAEQRAANEELTRLAREVQVQWRELRHSGGSVSDAEEFEAIRWALNEGVIGRDELGTEEGMAKVIAWGRAENIIS